MRRPPSAVWYEEEEDLEALFLQIRLWLEEDRDEEWEDGAQPVRSIRVWHPDTFASCPPVWSPPPEEYTPRHHPGAERPGPLPPVPREPPEALPAYGELCPDCGEPLRLPRTRSKVTS